MYLLVYSSYCIYLKTGHWSTAVTVLFIQAAAETMRGVVTCLLVEAGLLPDLPFTVQSIPKFRICVSYMRRVP